MKRPDPDFDVTVVIRVCDDEERIGHLLARIARHLRSLGTRFEILVADEGSGDNTVAVATMMKPTVRELEIVHADTGRGFVDACARARGRAVVLYDARVEAPLAPLGYALERLRAGVDVFAVDRRYLVFRRTRAWRAFEALVGRGEFAELEHRFVKKARALDLKVESTRRPRRAWPLRRWKLLGTLVAART